MRGLEFIPFVRAGTVHLGTSREDVRRAIGLPRSQAQFYWTETFGEVGGPSWFVAYDESGRVVHVEAQPSFDPVTIPAGVQVGVSRPDVWRFAGPPPIPEAARDYFFENDVGVAVEYDDEFRAVFVEVSGPIDVVFEGFHLLTTPADELLARIPYARAPASSLFAARSEPTYPEIGLALWRSAVPEDDPDDAALLHFKSAALARRGYWS